LNRPRKVLLIVIFTLLTAVFSLANDIYIAQTAAGGNTGVDCSDAYAMTFFNSSANWGSGSNKIGPGTTVHLCGTFNAPAGSSGYLTFQGNGNNGAPITLVFEAGATLTAPYWGTNGAISANGGSYLVVDGVCTASNSTGQCTSTQGTIQATLDGSPGATCPAGPCQYQQNGFAVNLSPGSANCNNCEIENLTIANLYIHTATSNDSGGNNGIGMNGNNISIDNNNIHDTGWAINTGYTSAGTSNVNVFNNTIYNIDHGVAVGDSGSASLTGLYVYNNTIHDFSNWDTTGDYWHHDGIHVFANNSSTLSSPIAIYNNYIYGNFGNNLNAGIYIEVAVSGASIATHYVFNNIFAPSAGTSANGAINDKVNGTCGSFFNNDGIGQGSVSGPGFNFGEGGGTCTGGYVENSIFAGTGATGNIGVYALNARPTESDYNVWYNTYFGDAMYYSADGDWFVCVIHQSGCTGTSAWDQTTGFDSHSTMSSPALTSASTCSSGTATGCGLSSSTSAAHNAGTNLYNTCNGQPNPGLGALCYDYAGNQRPQSGNWDIGALVYGTTTTPPPPNPPSGLTASVQ
jgi:hypothetical protein